MAKITKLTDNSWILRSGDAAAGLLFRQDNGYLFLNPKSRLTFEDLKAVEAKFGSLKLIERETEQEHTTLNGYPVKYQGYEVVSENPPLFTKGGKTVFAVGYWGLRFNQGWTQAYCPKKATLDTYDHVGPFKNRLEMLNHLTSLNNQDNLKSIDANKKA